MRGNIDEFCEYLAGQIGQPYVWGGQHLKLTPDNYETVIAKREHNAEYRAQAEKYCADAFERGASVLYGYDCSGLGMYWLQNLKRIYGSDLNADGMMGKCSIVTEPKRGYWVFRVTDGKATHIGYMISDTDVIHAKGRKYGVVREAYKKSYWHRIGKPSCMEFPTMRKTVRVVGGSVNVRTGNGSQYDRLGTAHKGDTFAYLGEAERDPYWYMIDYHGQQAYISCNQRYTEVIG